MKKSQKTYTSAEANVQLHMLLQQWQANAGELAKRSPHNPKVRTLLQSLSATCAACEDWFDLPGETQIIVAYQPAFGGLIDDDDRQDDVPY